MSIRRSILVTSAALFIACGSTLAATATTKPVSEAADDDDTSMSSMAMTDMADAKAPTAPAVLTKEQSDYFESNVRPILITNCYKCHSLEEKKTKGGLTLDTRDGWEHGGKTGPAINPGDAEKSLLVKAISYKDADLQMPPDDKLKDEDIATLTEWINMGAPDPRSGPSVGKLTGLTDAARAHWSYQPIKNYDVPEVKDAKWATTPIDAFILAKLESNDMRPSQPATREALIRRATYDLTGLPPTPEEVESFVRDRTSQAFEKVVDRLLASPHFGERWGRYWLDTARYSDTTGGESKKEEYRFPFAWTFRDYVINSFNAGKPYDEFLKEQIAADLLPEAKKDPSSLAALGFITVGKRFQNPNDTIDERIDALTKGTMALTVSCARCHDHKFDPIPTADYYSLHGVFASVDEPTDKPFVQPKDSDSPDYRDFKKELDGLEARNRELYYGLIEKKSNEFRDKVGAYVMIAATGRKGNAADVTARNELIKKKSLDRDIYQGAFRNLRRDSAVFGPLLAFSQAERDNFEKDAPRTLRLVTSGGPQRRPFNSLVVKAFKDAPADSIHSLQDVVDIYAKLFDSIRPQAKAYFVACKSATSTKIDGFDESLVELINAPIEVEPSPALTTEHLTDIAPSLPVVNQRGYDRLVLTKINELLLTHPGSPARAMVVEDLSRPRNSPIFIRGEATNRGKVVPRQFLEVLSGPNRKPFSQGSGRLELAQYIASKDNPLTARVAVNRIWMHLFGQAFVRTPDDLGVQCEAPSHPELLDYLASQFMNDGWSQKKLIRGIMLSAAYQQSCDTNRGYSDKDPENRLMWRGNLRRLDFEAIRDTMLSFTGNLDDTVGGKPVNLADEPYSNRRSVYGYIDRGNLPEIMQQFDFSDPDMTNSRRTSTIVPQQALFFMNSPMSVDVARKVVTRKEFLEAKDDAGRVRAIYEVLFQRQPKAVEVRYAKEFFMTATPAELTAIGVGPAAKPQSVQAQRDAQRAEKTEQLRQEREQRIREQQLKRKDRQGGRGTILNDGDLVARKPLNLWEQYAQALLFTNEIAYLN